MIRNFDLNKTVTIKQIQDVLEEVFPEDGETEVIYKNPDGFGGHYYVDNWEVLDIEKVVKRMVEEADRGN